MTDNYDLKYYKDIKSKKVDWLWYPYIPYGKITIVQGDPGEGKTTVLLNIISLLSNGEALPFTDKALSITSIYQNAEDDNSDTIKPRLENHKANCSKVCFIEKTSGMLFMDDDSVEDAIVESKAKLLVLDPIQAYIGDNIDMNRANSIRPKMNKLKETAEKTGCAIVLIGHMNKNSGGKANYRGLGSIDISAAARSVLVVGKMEKNSDVKVLAQLKNNLAPKGKSLSFVIKKDTIEWLGECDISADDVMSGGVSDTSGKIILAEEFLIERLTEESVPSNMLYEEAEQMGLSKRTLKRAKVNLPICSVKRNGCWYWEMKNE